MKPLYAHDCLACRFIGQTIGGQKIHDLYIHSGPSEDTVVARYGNEGPEYISRPIQDVRPQGHAELWAAKTWGWHARDPEADDQPHMRGKI